MSKVEGDSGEEEVLKSKGSGSIIDAAIVALHGTKNRGLKLQAQM